MDRDHSSALVLADGFSWLGLILTWIWLFWRGLWIAGLIVFVLQIGAILLMAKTGFAVAGALILVALALAVGLEGRHLHAEMLTRRGWRLETVLFAQTLTTAEEMYFSSLPAPQPAALPAVGDWASAKPASKGWRNAAGLGLFDHGGR